MFISVRLPWAGIPPLGWARSTGALAGNVEARLADEAGQEAGSILPIPDQGDQDADALNDLRTTLKNLRGKLALAPTTSKGWGDPGGAPSQALDWKPRRLGADPPVTLATLRSDASQAVLGACGVPPVLFSGQAPGVSLREAWREFLHASVQPVADLVAEELSRKLDVEVSLSFDKLFASDLSGRARAFQSMVGGGMDVTKAAGLAGLMEEE